MRRVILAIALRFCLASAIMLALAPLTGCVGTSQISAATIDRVQARYDRLRPFAELVLPSLPSARAARVRLALATIERALAAAKVATTIIEHRRAIAEAEAALAVVAMPGN